MNDGTDRREMAGTALCAVLSLAAFVPLILYAGRVPAMLAVAISLACPAVWLLFFGGNGGERAELPALVPAVEKVELAKFEIKI